MTIRRLSFKVDRDDVGKPLDQFLAEELQVALGEPISKSKVRKLIMAGAIYLNRQRIRFAYQRLEANTRVDAHIDFAKLKSDSTAQDRAFDMSAGQILFEDEYLIGVDKPPGLPTQPTVDETRETLYGAVKRFLATRDGIAEPYLGIHQRLDRDTSGIVIFTKDPAANAGLAESFATHSILKVYHALVGRPAGGPPASEWTVQNNLGKDRHSKGKKAKYTALKTGGDFAHTDFYLLEDLGEALWVEAHPWTGRTHQIRVHLSEQGMPVLGDTLYGRSKDKVPRLMLHAKSLGFIHPIHKVEVSIQSPLPEDFNQCLDGLRGENHKDTKDTKKEKR